VKKIIVLAPAHFHAVMVLQDMYPDIDPEVLVFTPGGLEMQQFQKQLAIFNNRSNTPTHWKECVYTAPDYLEKLLAGPSGNIVVIAGNNQLKSTYIQRAVSAGMHVLADKPMAVDSAGFELLKHSFEAARLNNVLLYDMMTERYDIHSILQRELSLLPDVFGQLELGTPESPAVVSESVHHFKKNVNGNVLVRPAWYMDVDQQGEGIVDVTTHLVDLIQWTCFPEKIIDYKQDIQVNAARRWPTSMTIEQYKTITGETQFPDYLKKDIDKDHLLQIYANGAFDYRICGVHASVQVSWQYTAAEGTGDTHFSLMRGTKANLMIRQGVEERFRRALYITPVNNDESYEQQLLNQLVGISQKYPGVTLEKMASGWEVVIPETYKKKHESAFARVMQHFLMYVRTGKMPVWEVPNMLAKYYTTTRALELAKADF
jgi:predicted dehydrogenase